MGRKPKPKIDLPIETPSDPEAETKILAALSRGFLNFEKVEVEDFYEKKNREIFKVLEYLKSLIPNIDPDIVHKEISKRNISLGAEGLIYVEDVLGREGVTPETTDHWFNILKDVSNNRKLLIASMEVTEGLQTGTLSLDQAMEKINCLNLKPKKNEKDINYIAHFDNLVDVVEDEGEIKFLVSEDDELKLKTEITIEGEVFYPPPREYLISCLKLLPRASEVLKYYKSDNEFDLYNDLITYHKEVSELPNESYYDLLVLWDFHTYLLNKLNNSPIIWLYGVSERGKSRTGKGCLYVAYRGVHIETLREAHILRFSEHLKATLFFDVVDLWKKAQKNESQDIILNRFERGSTTPRVTDHTLGPFKDTTFYDPFGATIIGTNEEVESFLSSRSIRATMQQTDKSFDREVTPKAGLELKERLLGFKARFMHKDLPRAGKPFNSRLGDISRPLLRILLAVNPEKEESFIKFLKNLNNDTLMQKSETREGKILAVIDELIDNKGLSDGGIIRMSDITDHYNNKHHEGDTRYNLSPNSAGITTAKLGLRKGRDDKGAYFIYIPDNFYPVCISYGIEISEDKYCVNKSSQSRQSRQSRQESNDYSDLEHDVSPDDYIHTDSQTSAKRQQGNSLKSLKKTSKPVVSVVSPEVVAKKNGMELPEFLKTDEQ